jgi:succinyl-CoA synthetase beta subunit
VKIHEFQAKKILADFGVMVPRGAVIGKIEEVERLAHEISCGGKIVVKAQIHAGGRGKAGGVKIAQNPAEAVNVAERLLGKPLVTHQTGPEGKVVHQLLVEEVLPIKREFYLSLLLDRERACPLILASAEGGVEIEQLAARSPEKIGRWHINPLLGPMPYQARQLAAFWGLDRKAAGEVQRLLQALYQAFWQKDATLVEINPLVLTEDGRLIALDAKMNFDDNALFRQPGVAELRDLSEEHPLEVKAASYDLSYIRLDGNIGCMVNGAGLAMATMDIILLCGGRPANFLDVGGGTDARRVAAAFEILLAQPGVKAVLVNIFGGIVRCDTIAEGIVTAARNLKVEVPLVVRLQGTLVDKGRQILAASGLPITSAEGMEEAAHKAVELAGGGK